MPRLPAAFAAAFVVAACNHSTAPNGTDSSGLPGMNVPGLTARGPGVLTASPLDTATLFQIDPLGQLGPPGHTLPSDHQYWWFVSPTLGGGQADCSKRPVYAAGAGTVTFIYVTEPGSQKVMVTMTQTFAYYYDHVVLDANVQLGTAVTAGQRIGSTDGLCPTIDVGIIDLDVTLTGLVTPERYNQQTRYTGEPIAYFSEPLRSKFYRLSSRAAGDPYRGGKIDYSVKGQLVGDWFDPSLPKTYESTGPAGWTKCLAFVYDNRDPSQVRVSIGGGALPLGLWSVQGNAPDPASVNVATGKVVYTLVPYGGASQPGKLAVQLIADDRIRIQVFPGSTDPNPAFTSAAVEYVR